MPRLASSEALRVPFTDVCLTYCDSSGFVLRTIVVGGCGVSLAGGSVGGKPAVAGCSHAVFAGRADGFTTAGVFVVRGDISDRFVESHGVPVDLHGVEFRLAGWVGR